jgi:signal transduction histidine kinase
MTLSDAARARVWGFATKPLHMDLAIAAVVVTVTLVTTTAGPQGGRLDPVALVAGTLAGGALVARRRFPFATLLVSAIAAEAYLVHYHGRHGTLVLAAPLVALCTLAEVSTRRRGLIVGCLLVLVFGAVHVWLLPTSWLGADNLALAAFGGLAVAAGTASRHRRAYLAEVQARAEQAEADREAEANRRVTEERLRIARDLHDVIGHHLALIHVQARVAAHEIDPANGAAARALDHVCAASKAALTELGDTIGLLRQPGDPANPTDPVGGLATIDDLLAAYRRYGLDVEVEITGTARPVAASADLAAYRVIQESLTNVCKHAGRTSVTVGVAYRPQALVLTVDNRSTGPVGPGGGGHGQVGMRERVTALGGSFAAGPAPGGRYRVTAHLPLAA